MNRHQAEAAWTQVLANTRKIWFELNSDDADGLPTPLQRLYGSCRERLAALGRQVDQAFRQRRR